MNVAELSRIDRAIEIAASPERVYRALTDPTELSAWFKVRVEGTIAAGQELWMTVTHAPYEGQRFRVIVVELTPSRRVVWKWHPGEIDPNVDYSTEPMTVVTFTLEPAGDGTRLSVSETGFDEVSLARRAQVFKANTQGWTEVLPWIKSHVEAQG